MNYNSRLDLVQDSRYDGFVKKKIGLLIGTSITAGVFGLIIGRTTINVPSYQAIRIIDGDTFETKEKQWIRISGIDAPESGLCGSEEAKQQLGKFILGKDLYIKVTYHDSTRLMGLVYTKNGLVATKMLETGWAERNDRDNLDLPELEKASELAKTKKLGLNSSLCTQETNLNNPKCLIKGNITTNNVPTYHFPGCNSYNTTIVQLHHGDKWFCTEEEAANAGFVKAETCPASY